MTDPATSTSGAHQAHLDRFRAACARNARLLTSTSALVTLATLAGAGLAAFATDTAHAQTEADTSASGKIREILVTARKRDESLLEVPLAINALSADTLEMQNITSLQDVAEYTPSLQINDVASNQATRNNQQIILRGMFTQGSQGVSVFIDGAPVGTGIVSSIKDAARVEILKGPQTAYFGRQTFSGAVNIVTKDPADHLAGSMDVLYGTDDWHDISASIEGPITSWLSGRIMARDMKKGGQYTNTVDGTTLGTQGTQSVALNLKATPFDGFTAKFYATYWQDRDGPAAIAKLTSEDYNCNAGAAAEGTNNFICGELPILSNSRVGMVTALPSEFIDNVLDSTSTSLNPYFKDIIRTAGFGRDAMHAHLNLEYAPDSWGGISLTSLTGYNQSRSEAISNLDNQDTRDIANPYAAYIAGTLDYTLWLARVQSRSHDFSQELRLASGDDGALHWMAGVNYAKNRSQSYIDGLFPYGVGTFGSGGYTQTETKGVFFALGYDITDKLNVNFEGRYQQDKVGVYSRSRTASPSVIASTRTEKFLPRVSLQYQIDPQIMVYASYAEGVNPPAFNTSLVGIDEQLIAEFKDIYGATYAVKPETNQDVEVGVKGQFLDGHLQLTLDAYYTKWKNQIVSIFGVVPGVEGVNGGEPYSTNVMVNAGETTLYGLEAEGLLALDGHLSFDFSAAWNPTRIDSYPNYVCPASACVADNGYTNVDGNSLPYGPQFGANIGVTYKGQVTDSLDFFLRAEDNYKGKRYVDVTNLSWIGASNKVNLRGGLSWGSTRLEAFVENLFNMRQYSGYYGGTDIDSQANESGVYPAAFQVVMPALRRFGLKLSHDF